MSDNLPPNPPDRSAPTVRLNGDASAPPDPVGGQPLGASYRLYELLGRGAMGEVFRGRTLTGDEVAVKILRPELAGDPGMVARFLQERGILTGLSHPNIVHVRDLVAEGSTLAIVMDLVHGNDLRTELTRRGTFPAAEASALTVSVLRGLAAVHATGVVHRDMKPENVLLDTQVDPAVPIPRITDFGVSKLASGGTSTRRTSVIGTPEYMAPELIDDREPSIASDLYSVGIMLYELLCGVTPFTGGSPLAVLRKHAEYAPGRPVGIPDPLWAVIAGLLAKRPEDRPSSAAEAAAALDSLLGALAQVPALSALTNPPEPDLDGATVLNTLVPESPTQPVSPARRPRWRLLAIGLAAVLVLGGGATAAALAMKGKPKTAAAATSPTSTATVSASTTAAGPLSTATTTDTSTPTGTDTASATSTVTGSGNPSAIMPQLTGHTLSDAVSALSQLGVRYQIKEVLDSQATDNMVIGQQPPAGQPAGDLVVVSVSRTAVLTDLQDVGALGDSPDSGPITISGKTYAHGLFRQLCQGSAVWEYDIGKDYRLLRGVAGVTDTSSHNASYQVEVSTDQRKVWSKTVSLGHPQPFSIDVTGALRLSITITTLTCAYDDPVRSTAAFGDPQLLGLPGEVPTPTLTP